MNCYETRGCIRNCTPCSSRSDRTYLDYWQAITWLHRIKPMEMGNIACSDYQSFNRARIESPGVSMEQIMPAKNNSISAFVITKNNSEKIGACLESLAWADEVVVVDDFSTDATPEICRKFANVRFFQNRFEGFQEQKHHAVSLASHDWILKIDADECVSETMKASILALTDSDFASCSCFEFKRLTCFWGKWIRHASLYPDYSPRLMNKHQGSITSGINPHDKFKPHGKTKRLTGDLLHYQNWDLYTYATRTILYSNISAQEYFKLGKSANLSHITIRPFYTFIYRYLIRLGFLEGIRGLVISVMGGVGTFVKYSKLLELQRELHRPPTKLI